jgi:hypothetical protein
LAGINTVLNAWFDKTSFDHPGQQASIMRFHDLFIPQRNASRVFVWLLILMRLRTGAS